MGLDVYFYCKKINQHIDEDWNITKEDITELNDLLKELKIYSLNNELKFSDCLKNAIKDYLYHNNSDEMNEVMYFRKFWFILEYFNYTDEDYGTNKLITKEQLENLKSYLEKVLNNVETNYTENYPKLISSNDSSKDLVNKVFEMKDELCAKELNSSDYGVFDKTQRLYKGVCSLLQNTDFDSEQVFLNADW